MSVTSIFFKIKTIYNPYLIGSTSLSINYGIESYNEEILQVLRKGFNKKNIENAIEWTKSAGIEIQAYFMLGNPNETVSQLMETINFANKINPDFNPNMVF